MRKPFMDTTAGKGLLAAVAAGTLGTAVGSTTAAVISANATEAAAARNGTVRQKDPIYLHQTKRSLPSTSLPMAEAAQGKGGALGKRNARRKRNGKQTRTYRA